MDTLARKIIDAIQNSLVGDLLVKLYWPLGYMWAALTERAVYPDFSKPLIASWLAAGAIGVCLAWLLGKIAKTAPRLTKDGFLMDQVARPLENGFQTWSQPPADGLRPPRLMRRFVEVIGETKPLGEQKLGWLSFSFLISTVLVGISLVFLPKFWFEIHPLFASEPTRIVLVQTCLIVLVAFQVRQWATEQKRRLAAQEKPFVSTAMSPV